MFPIALYPVVLISKNPRIFRDRTRDTDDLERTDRFPPTSLDTICGWKVVVGSLGISIGGKTGQSAFVFRIRSKSPAEIWALQT
jgi:hypothetical protein